jgi:hypothetical protein
LVSIIFIASSLFSMIIESISPFINFSFTPFLSVSGLISTKLYISFCIFATQVYSESFIVFKSRIRSYSVSQRILRRSGSVLGFFFISSVSIYGLSRASFKYPSDSFCSRCFSSTRLSCGKIHLSRDSDIEY